MKCPICTHKLVNVVYGYPKPDMVERARNEEIALGGILKHLDMPTHYCYGCHETYPVSQTPVDTYE